MTFIRARIASPDPATEIERVIALLPGARRPESSRFVIEGRDHVAAIEVTSNGAGSIASVRFDLSQPPEVDAVFAALVVALARRLRGKVTIEEDIGVADMLLEVAYGDREFAGLEGAIAACVHLKRKHFVPTPE
jgi:hypothetical protein